MSDLWSIGWKSYPLSGSFFLFFFARRLDFLFFFLWKDFQFFQILLNRIKLDFRAENLKFVWRTMEGHRSNSFSVIFRKRSKATRGESRSKCVTCTCRTVHERKPAIFGGEVGRRWRNSRAMRARSNDANEVENFHRASVCIGVKTSTTSGSRFHRSFLPLSSQLSGIFFPFFLSLSSTNCPLRSNETRKRPMADNCGCKGIQ